MNQLASPNIAPQPNRRGLLAPALAGLGIVGLFFAQNARSESLGKSPNKPPVICEYSGEQEFTFGVDNYQGGGVNDAVHAVVGSGNGEGDPCFRTTKNLVIKQVGDGQPQFRQKIVIPASVTHKQ